MINNRKYIHSFKEVRNDDTLIDIDTPSIMGFRSYMYYLVEILPNEKNWEIIPIDDTGLSFNLPKESNDK